MGDLALVILFLCMLIVPCYLAMRSVRGKKAVLNVRAGVFAVAESFDDGENSAARAEFTIDRQALAIQRNREIYFRMGRGSARPVPDRLIDRSRVFGARRMRRKVA